MSTRTSVPGCRQPTGSPSRLPQFHHTSKTGQRPERRQPNSRATPKDTWKRMATVRTSVSWRARSGTLRLKTRRRDFRIYVIWHLHLRHLDLANRLFSRPISVSFLCCLRCLQIGTSAVRGGNAVRDGRRRRMFPATWQVHASGKSRYGVGREMM